MTGEPCPWARSTPDYLAYHDEEWGRSVTEDDALFERISLEAFQSGLSWLTILRKRENFRAAFAAFSIEAVARFGAREKKRLLADAGIVRNRAKIEATLANARAAAANDGRPARDDRGIDGAREGAQAPRLPLRRPNHGLRGDAGLRRRQRPPRRLPARAAVERQRREAIRRLG